MNERSLNIQFFSLLQVKLLYQELNSIRLAYIFIYKYQHIVV